MPERPGITFLNLDIGFALALPSAYQVMQKERRRVTLRPFLSLGIGGPQWLADERNPVLADAPADGEIAP